MAIFTAGLVFVSGVQIGYLIKADNRATAADNRAAKADDRAAKAEERAADANRILEQQRDLTGKQADIARRQQGLLHAQYYAQNRPRLVVKDEFVNMDGGISFEIANIGGIPAVIGDGWAAVGHVDDDRSFKLRDQGELLRRDMNAWRFDAGELKAFSMGDQEQIGGRLSDPLWFLGHPENVFFYGAFHYIDDRGPDAGGVMRIAVFRRHWNTEAGAFQRTQDPDHEYSD